MGVYTAEKTNGVSVCISYTPPGETRIRENFRFVEHGLAFRKRLGEVKREAEKELTWEMPHADACSGRNW